MPFKNPFKSEAEAEASDPNDPEVRNEPPAKSPAELIAESLKPLTDSLSGVGTTLTSIGDRLTALEQRTPQRQQPTENQPSRISVFDDEEAFAAQTVAPLMQRQYALEATLARDRVRLEYERKGYADMWTAFEEQINAQLEATPLLQNVNGEWRPWRADPVCIRKVVSMIFGDAAIKAGMRFGGTDKGFFLESVGGGENGPGNVQVGDGLTDGQRRIFDRMKGPDGKPISADARKSTLGKLKFVN